LDSYSEEKSRINVGDVIRCPTEVCESGLIKIVGDHTGCKANKFQPQSQWEYLAVDFDKAQSGYFRVTKKEIEEWKNVSS